MDELDLMTYDRQIEAAKMAGDPVAHAFLLGKKGSSLIFGGHALTGLLLMQEAFRLIVGSVESQRGQVGERACLVMYGIACDLDCIYRKRKRWAAARKVREAALRAGEKDCYSQAEREARRQLVQE